MRSQKPIPRSPRNTLPAPGVRRNFERVRRFLWVAVSVIGTALIAIVSMGADSVLKIPEIPAALNAMISKSWNDYQITRGLTKTWELVPLSTELEKGQKPLRLVIQHQHDTFSGQLYSPMVREWSPNYDMALVEGQTKGAVLHLTVFDFVLGERKDLARIDVLFQETPSSGITEQEPKLVMNELIAKTVWQVGNVLPLKFTLTPAVK